MTHTPTPWHYDRTTLSWYVWPEKGPWVCNGVMPADTWHMSKEEKDATEHMANAAFIVKACNSHDELVAALKNSLDWLASYQGGGAVKAYEQALKALGKASAP